MQTVQADYFTAYHNLKLTRDANGVLKGNSDSLFIIAIEKVVE